MNEQIIRKACRELMRKTELVYVSTIDDNGYPQTRAMYNLKNLKVYGRLNDFFARQQNDFTAYLSTNRASVKMVQIGKNSKVCLYYCSLPDLHGLALAGNMEVIEDVEIKKTLWQEDWVQFYKDGFNGSDYTVLRVKPALARGWYKTTKYEFIVN